MQGLKPCSTRKVAEVMNNADYDLVIAGGGLAGCSAAITAARAGARVLLLERGSYPRHKVCGEFVSAEALSLLRSLLRDLPEAGEALHSAPAIGRARLFLDDRVLEAAVDPPAASLPRWRLDALLWQAAAAAGAHCRDRTNVVQISRDATAGFQAQTSAGAFRAAAVIQAGGRPPGSNSAEKWIGLKGHFNSVRRGGQFGNSATPASVDLYFFDGGYCGVLPVDANRVNVCAMVQSRAARALDEVFVLHPQLWRRSRPWQAASPPVATAPLLFSSPTPDRDGILLAGDAAAFIDPFVGDGISLALHSGSMAAAALKPIWHGTHDLVPSEPKTGSPRDALEAARAQYRSQYRRQLLPAFSTAAHLRRLLRLPRVLRSLLWPVFCSESIQRRMLAGTRAKVEDGRLRP